MSVRLFIGNLPYTASEADLRDHLSAVAPPSHVFLPVDRATGRPRGFAFVEFPERDQAEEAIRRLNGQPFKGRPLAVSEARARDEAPGPRPQGSGYVPQGQPAEPSAPGAPAGRQRNFGPPAPPRRGGKAPGRRGSKGEPRPRGPIKTRTGGRLYNVDDGQDDDWTEADTDDFDNIAVSSGGFDEDEEQND